MITGEFEVMERYLRELEALQRYPQVKKERDYLADEVPQLTEKVRLLAARAKSDARLREKTASQLRERESELRQLKQKLEKADTELSSLRDFKARLPGSSGLSLRKMKEQFLRAQAVEIESKARERAAVLETELRSRMPALIQEELIRVLNGPDWPADIEQVVSSRASQVADEILRDKQKWPVWFGDYYLQQVKETVARQLDREFDNRVKAEAQNRLETLKSGEWERYSAAKATKLASNLGAMMSELQGTRWFTCDRCGRRFGVEIGPSEVAHLVGQGTVDVTCSSCLDPGVFPFILNSVPHKVTTVSLRDLILLYLGKVSQ